jgi:transcription initiation factor TFIIF subunit beta
MATPNGLKTEEDAPMKSEMDDVPTIGFVDDDEEDTGELAFPPSMPTVWLTRVPRFLWQVLAAEKQDEEIQIGTVKHWTAPDGQQKVRVRLALLSPPLQLTTCRWR